MQTNLQKKSLTPEQAMMDNNWDNFLKNLGHWEGSFTFVSLEGELGDSTPSILDLEGFEENKLVRFRLRRYGPAGYIDPPVSDYSQDYRTLGRQVVFFETGAFSKGTLQLAPFSEFGAEYGFVSENRRLRFVQLYDDQGNLATLVLIREFRSGSNAQERPRLTIEQMIGRWQGTATKVYCDWQPSETYSTFREIKYIENGKVQQELQINNQTIISTGIVDGNILHIENSDYPRRVLLLDDGTFSNAPLSLKLRESFDVELGWMAEQSQFQRLIRSYNEKGQWISSTFIVEQKVS